MEVSKLELVVLYSDWWTSILGAVDMPHSTCMPGIVGVVASSDPMGATIRLHMRLVTGLLWLQKNLRIRKLHGHIELHSRQCRETRPKPPHLGQRIVR